MTNEETERFLKYALTMYPNVKLSQQTFAETLRTWRIEFRDDPKDVVVRAFKLAQAEEPDWMPTIPKVKFMIDLLAAQIKTKSPEQEFMDSHCGKTKEEWECMNLWRESPEGLQKIKSYKEQFSNLINKKLAEV